MFQLHERLAADTHNLGRSRLCEILLMNDRTWPWIILVPAVPDIREIYQLGKEQQQRRGGARGLRARQRVLLWI